MQIVDKAQLKEWMTSGEDILLINVLSRHSFREQHIPGSINISLKETGHFVEAAEWFGAMPELRIIVYSTDAQCGLASQAVQMLHDAGFAKACALKDGVDGWFASNRTKLPGEVRAAA